MARKGIINNVNSKCIKSGVHIYRKIPLASNLVNCVDETVVHCQRGSQLKYRLKQRSVKVASRAELQLRRCEDKVPALSVGIGPRTTRICCNPRHHITKGLTEKTMFICSRQRQMSKWLIWVYDDIASPFI